MYWIKDFGATISDFRLFKLPKVIQRARIAVPDDDVVGYFICALERPPQMTGLLFCDQKRHFPQGLPVRTLPLVSRCWRHDISRSRSAMVEFLLWPIGCTKTEPWIDSTGCTDTAAHSEATENKGKRDGDPTHHFGRASTGLWTAHHWLSLLRFGSISLPNWHRIFGSAWAF